ncbi:hypothetical protein HDE_12786 [Halotydeus destructor]|nr:hypothetical protein HDE_12786 [Halotydeus destructor]
MEVLDLSNLDKKFWISEQKINWLISVIFRCGRSLRFIHCDPNILVKVWLTDGFPEKMAVKCPKLEEAFIPYCHDKDMSYSATLRYAESIPGGSHFRTLRLTSVTTQDTDFYKRLLQASPRVEYLELSARMTYDWCVPVLKDRKNSSQLKRLMLFMDYRSLDEFIELVHSSPKLNSVTINGFMHEDVTHEFIQIVIMSKLAMKLPVLETFKLRLRTHLIPIFAPILGHLVTELIIEGGDEHVYLCGIDEKLERLRKLKVKLQDTETIRTLAGQLPNSVQILELDYQCDDQEAIQGFLRLRGEQFNELSINCPTNC